MRHYLNSRDLLSQCVMTRGDPEKLMKIRIISGNGVLMSIYSAVFIVLSAECTRLLELQKIEVTRDLYRKKWHKWCFTSDKTSSGVGALSAALPLASRRFWSRVEVESGDH